MFKNTRIFTFTALAVLGLSLTACETIDGAGRDIESAGEVVQDAAN